MKVKEAKERLDSLKNIHDNALKLNECCMNNKEALNLIEELENESGINTSLNAFASCVATFVADERKRISDLIDNAEINID